MKAMMKKIAVKILAGVTTTTLAVGVPIAVGSGRNAADASVIADKDTETFADAEDIGDESVSAEEADAAEEAAAKSEYIAGDGEKSDNKQKPDDMPGDVKVVSTDKTDNAAGAGNAASTGSKTGKGTAAAFQKMETAVNANGIIVIAQFLIRLPQQQNSLIPFRFSRLFQIIPGAVIIAQIIINPPPLIIRH